MNPQTQTDNNLSAVEAPPASSVMPGTTVMPPGGGVESPAASVSTPVAPAVPAPNPTNDSGSPLQPEILSTELWGNNSPPPPPSTGTPSSTPWFRRLWFIALAALLIAGATVAYFWLVAGNNQKETTSKGTKAGENYEVTSVPLSELAANEIIAVDNGSQLSINGQLRINNSAVIEATESPETPELGQLWLSSENNTLYYYNGTQWVPVSTTIGGVGGTLGVGSGISIAGNTILNSGVTSLQGQTGAVNLNAGGGISISGTTISVSGVQQGGVLVGAAGGAIGTVLPSSPGLCLISNGANLPEFGSCTGTTVVTSLNTMSGALNIAAGSGISVTPSGGNTLTIGTTGGTGVTQLNGASGALSIADANHALGTITINRASAAQLGLVQGDGSTVVINGSGVISIGQDVATSANVTFNSLALTTDLAVSNGGTGASSFAAGGLLVGDGTNPISVVTALSSGQCLLSTGSGTAPSFQNCPVGGNISQGTQSGEAQNAGTLVKYGTNANSITNSIIADNGTTATVTGNLTVNSGIITGSGSGITNVNAALLQGFTASAFEPAFVTLGVNSGGTGAATLTANGILLGNGVSPITAISPANSGLCLMSTGTGSAPTFQSCPVGGNVSATAGSANYLTKFSANGIDIENADLLAQTGGLQVTAASYYLDIFNGTDSNFTIQNTNGGGIANLTVDGRVTGSNGLSVGTGKNITSESGGIKIAAGNSNSDNITFETRDSSGNLLSFIFPSSGGLGQTICTSGITCASGGGQAVILEPGTGSGTAQSSAASRPSIWINRTSGTSEILKLQASGKDALVLTYDGKVSLGTSGPSGLTGELLFRNATNSSTISLKADQPGSSYTLTLPNDDGGTNDCLKSDGSGVLSWGTCVAGGSGGGITGSGTLNAIALFTPNGQSLGSSIITQPTSSLIDIEGNLQLGTPNTLTGQLVFSNSGTTNTVTLQSGVAGGNLTFTLPTADGSANQCLKTNGSGELGFTTCLSGGGSGGGVTELNNISGDVDILGTANQITVTPSGQNITLSLPQNITTSSNVTFAGLSLGGAGQLTLGNGSGQAGTVSVRDGSSVFSTLLQHGGALSSDRTITIPDAAGTLAVSASGNIALSASGNITFSGTLPVGSGGTGSSTAAGARTNLGAAASGANTDITSLSAVTAVQNASGALTVGNTGQALTLQGSGTTKLTATTGGITNELVFATPTASAKTITIPDATGTICLQNSGSCGFLTAAVTSLQGQTGDLNLVAGTGIGIAGLTISNDGVTSLTGTANKISVSGATGSITLSLPNDVYVGTSGSAAGTLSIFDVSGGQRAILQPANLASDRTITIPDAAGTLAVSASGNIALSASGNITFSGTLPVGSGGTGVTGAPANGQLLIGNGTGYTLATLTAGTGVTITNGAGSITVAAPAAGQCATCANQALSNLSGTTIGNNVVPRLVGAALTASDITDTGSAIAIGDAVDASQTVTIQGGTSASAVSIQSQAGGTIGIGTANAANTIQIGNTANALAQTINIGNNPTAGATSTILMGSTVGTSPVTIRSGTSGITTSSTTVSGTALSVTAASLTTGTGLDVVANALTTGTGLKVSTTSTAQTSGSLLSVSQNNAFTSATTVSGNTASISRVITGNVPSGGALALNSTAGTVTSGGNSIAHTVNAGSDRVMVVSTYGGVPSTWTVGATVQNFTRYGTSPFYYISNPTVGSGTVAFSSACNYNCTVSTWNNSNTANPLVGYQSNSCGSMYCVATSPALTTGPGDKLLSIGWSNGSNGVSGAGAGQFLLGSVRSYLNGFFYDNVSAHYKDQTSGSTSASYTAGWIGADVYATALKQKLGAPSPVTGAVMSVANNCVIGSSSCADSSNVLDLNQQFTGATGAVLRIQNSSAAADIQLSATGLVQSQDQTSAATNSTNITIRSGNASGATSNSGSVAIDVGTATGTKGSVNIGTSNASNVTIGNTSGSNTVALQSGTGGIAASSTTTSGTAFMILGNSLTTGNGLTVSSSNSNYYSGSLTNIDHTATASSGATIAPSLLNASRQITTSTPSAPSVELDYATPTSTSASGASASWYHPIGSNTNRALVVTYSQWRSAAVNITCTATYDNLSMTVLAQQQVQSSFTWKSYIFGLKNPPIGNKQVSVSCDSGNTAIGESSSWYNVDQNTAFAGANSSLTSSVNVTGTTTRDKVVSHYAGQGINVAPTAPQIGYGYYAAGNAVYSSYLGGSGSGTTTMSYSNPGSPLAITGVAIKPSASPPIEMSGNLVNFSSNCIISNGGCTDSSTMLNLNQQYSGGTGAVLKIQNAGTGADIQLGKGNIQTAATNAASTNSNGVTITSGNALGASSNSGNITIDSGTATGTTGNIFIGNANAMTVTIGNTSSKLGAWQNNAGYNLVVSGAQYRAFHGSAVYNGYAYVVGGRSTGATANTATNTVYYARLKADGTIPTSGVGVWAAANSINVSGAKNRAFTQAVASNGYLYVVGGMDETATHQSTVYYAKINSDGSLGTWAATQSLPQARSSHSSFAANGYIYAMGGTNGTVQSTVYYARQNADGTLGSWGTTQPIGGASPVVRRDGTAAYVNGYVYYAGGVDASAAVSTVYYAKINSDGSIPSSGSGVWSTTNAINVSGNQPRYQHTMAASNGYLYLFGGVDGSGSRTNTMYTAPIVNDGTIGVWSSIGTLPSSFSGHATLAANGYFYNIGGIDGGSSTVNTVYIASTPRVRIGGNLDLIGTDNSGLTEGGAGGQLTAGNTRIVGTFEVSDQANFIQGVSIGGNLTVGGKGTDANPIFAVQNSSGANLFTVDTQNNNIQIGANNSAELQTWATNSVSLPANRRDVRAVSVNGMIYVVGGQDGTNPQDEVYYAKPNANGSISSWTTSANPLPSGQERYSHSVVAANGYIYAVGGKNNSAAFDTVYYSKINPDGSNGAWSLASTTLPNPRSSHSSVYANGYIYVIGGQNNSGPAQQSIYFAKVNPDGSLGTWSTEATNILPAARVIHSSAYINGYMYVTGGYDGSTYQSTIYYAPLNSNGSVGTWVTSGNPMATAKGGHSSVVANGRVYSVGGVNASGQLATYEYTTISGTGANGASTTGIRQFGQERHGHGGVVVNGYVYVIGGANASAQDEVYYSSTQRVSVGGTLDLIGFGGASMNDPGNNFGGGSLGGELTAGNTNIVGSIAVQGQASFSQDATIGRNLNVGGDVAVGGTLKVASDSATALRITKANGTSDILVVNNSSSVAVVTINATIAFNGRIITSGSTPSTAVHANAGTGATCTVNGNDTAGKIYLTTGSGAWASGLQCTLTFAGGAWADPPRIVVSPSAGGVSARQLWAETNTTEFKIYFDSAATGAYGYDIDYVILR